MHSDIAVSAAAVMRARASRFDEGGSPYRRSTKATRLGVRRDCVRDELLLCKRTDSHAWHSRTEPTLFTRSSEDPNCSKWSCPDGSSDQLPSPVPASRKRTYVIGLDDAGQRSIIRTHVAVPRWPWSEPARRILATELPTQSGGRSTCFQSTSASFQKRSRSPFEC